MEEKLLQDTEVVTEEQRLELGDITATDRNTINTVTAEALPPGLFIAKKGRKMTVSQEGADPNPDKFPRVSVRVEQSSSSSSGSSTDTRN